MAHPKRLTEQRVRKDDRVSKKEKICKCICKRESRRDGGQGKKITKGSLCLRVRISCKEKLWLREEHFCSTDCQTLFSKSSFYLWKWNFNKTCRKEDCNFSFTVSLSHCAKQMSPCSFACVAEDNLFHEAFVAVDHHRESIKIGFI